MKFCQSYVILFRHVKRGIEILVERGVNVTELEGVAVVDKSSGRVFVGGAAPRRRELIDWLQSHRSYQIHLPTSRRQSSTNKEPAGDSSENVDHFRLFVIYIHNMHCITTGQSKVHIIDNGLSRWLSPEIVYC